MNYIQNCTSKSHKLNEWGRKVTSHNGMGATGTIYERKYSYKYSFTRSIFRLKRDLNFYSPLQRGSILLRVWQ